MIGVAALLSVIAAPAVADPEANTARLFVAMVKQGGDVQAAYPDAVSAREAASLGRVKGCNPINLMKQKPGRYTVVWQCRGGMLGMGMNFEGGKLAMVETFEVLRRPRRES